MRGAKFSTKAAATALILSLLATGCSPTEAVEADTLIQPNTPVEVAGLKKTTIKNELTYIGQVEAQMEISVASKLAAEVKEVFFDIGDTVEEGDVLFTVDAEDIQNQVRQLQASVAQSQVAVEQAEYGLKIAQEGSAQERLTELQNQASILEARYGSRSAAYSSDSAKDAVDAAEYAESVAEATYAAELAYYELLVSTGVGNTLNGDVITQAMIDAQFKKVQLALAELSTAGAAVEQAKNGRRSASLASDRADAGLDIAYETQEATKELTQESKERAKAQAEFGVKTAQAAVNSAQVQLSITQSSLGHAIIKSPISGVISNRSIEVGQMISQVSLPFTIVKMDTVNVRVSVSEVLINNIQVGDEVDVLIQAIGDVPLKGTVAAVSPVAGVNSSFPVLVELSNTDNRLKPGMFGQVTFVQAQKDNTFVLDKSIITTDETEQFVYVVKDGVAEKRIVQTGLVGGAEVEVVSGLNVGEEIVVVGQEYIHDGVSVNIVKRDGAAVVEEPAVVANDEPEESGEAPEESISRQSA